MTSAVDLTERLRAGSLSARALTDACLERVAAREATVHAFAHLDPAHARRQADALDAHRKAGRPLGPLHGLPIGVKDIFDTADMPTENGTPLDHGRQPRRDATIVARLRAAGAVIFGKTVTTELAFQHPGPTRHPKAPSRTPGGSSSGSAAAVADGMIPLALGSQTVGSTIRPASFCGVVGYKPSHGLVPLTGALATAEPLDTVGLFSLTLQDAALCANVIQGFDGDDRRVRPAASADLLAAAQSTPAVPPLYAIIGGPFFHEASDDVKGLFAELADALGERADTVTLPDVFDNAFAAHMTLMKAGFARNLRAYLARGEAELSDRMRAAIAVGREALATDYLAALDWQSTLKAGLDRIFARYDAILTPAAPGEAPQGLTSTGDSRFDALWTFLGAPAVSLPFGTGSDGLPIGLQVVGRPGEDARLMRTAAALQRQLATDG